MSATQTTRHCGSKDYVNRLTTRKREDIHSHCETAILSRYSTTVPPLARVYSKPPGHPVNHGPITTSPAIPPSIFHSPADTNTGHLHSTRMLHPASLEWSNVLRITLHFPDYASSFGLSKKCSPRNGLRFTRLRIYAQSIWGESGDTSEQQSLLQIAFGIRVLRWGRSGAKAMSQQ